MERGIVCDIFDLLYQKPAPHPKKKKRSGPPCNKGIDDPITQYQQPVLMNPPCQNPVLVIVVLWGIAIFTTTYLFLGSPNIVSGILIQGVCMIGSAAYLRKSGSIGCPAH